YTADKEIVAEVTGVKLEDEDIEVTVTYTAQSGAITETKEVKQTIHYVYEDGKEAAPDKLDSVTFIRTVTTNEATGEVTYGEWTAKDDDTTFDEVKSPEIDNYTADKELIGEVTDLTGESKDNEVTVTYVPKIEERIETKEINRVIHYVYEDTKEAAPDKTDTVTFTRIMTKNLATGEVTYGEWTAADDDTTFDEVKSPKIDGYVADKKVIDKVTDLEVDDKDVEETVTYRKIASAPSSEEPSDSTKTSTTETTGSTTVSSESKSQTTTAVSKSSGGTTHQAAVTTKTTTSTKTLPSTGEKVRHYLNWFGGLAVAAAAIFGVLVNRSKRKIK
ncbi:MAG: mucin-binding protein, partial [Enterococcus sp.]